MNIIKKIIPHNCYEMKKLFVDLYEQEIVINELNMLNGDIAENIRVKHYG